MKKDLFLEYHKGQFGLDCLKAFIYLAFFWSLVRKQEVTLAVEILALS